LDWLMWFAALDPSYAREWLKPFVQRLLRNDPATLKLLRHNPFPDSPPRYIRAGRYDYRFTTWRELRREHAWWHRTLIGQYLPPVALAAAASVRNVGSDDGVLPSDTHARGKRQTSEGN
jgi:hypothetical protein